LSLYVAVRAPGSETWVAERLARRLVDPSGLTLGFGPQGQAIVAWTVEARRTTTVMVARRPPGGPFSPPTPVFRSRASLYGIDLDFDVEGRPTLAWSRGSVETGLVAVPARAAREVVRQAVVAVSGDAEGHFGRAQVVAEGCTEGDLAEAPSGAAAIAMVCSPGATRVGVRLSRRLPGGPFAPPEAVSRGPGDDYLASLAMDGNGRAVVSWLHRRSSFPPTRWNRLMLAHADPGQPVGPPRAVTPNLDGEAFPAPLIDPGGRPFLTWIDSSRARFLAAVHADDRLGPVSRIAPRNARIAWLAIDDQGRGLAVWVTESGQLQAGLFTPPS
jgi:hypothetical protein